MLARSLERTGGPEEEGVRMFKDELRETVLKKDSNRLGDFEDNEFFIVSTLCDPRYIFFAKNLFVPLLRMIFNDFCHSGLKTCFS